MSCHAKLVFSRHGESEWNVANRFTGWVDVDLSEKGVGEAKAAGDLIKEEGLKFDVCYTSFLKRAIKTCDYALEAADQNYVQVNKTWRLNERMYGGLTGLDKKETVLKHGADKVLIWRRSFDLPPPDIDEDSEFHPKREAKYAGLDPSDIPKTESLKTVIERVMPYWEEEIKPQLAAGKTVFVAAHGNYPRHRQVHREHPGRCHPWLGDPHGYAPRLRARQGLEADRVVVGCGPPQVRPLLGRRGEDQGRRGGGQESD